MLQRFLLLSVGGLALLAALFLWMVPAGGTAVAQSIFFVDSGQSIGTGASFGVDLGDLDGDGDLDAFVIRNAPNEIWINQGGAQGGTPGVFADSGQRLGSFGYESVALADLDGDTDLDAFVTRITTATDSNQVWINQGGEQGGVPGVFLFTGQVMADGLGRDVVLVDVNGDTFRDAYIARANVADQLWINDGTGQFSNSGQSLNSGSGIGATMADFDGDNDPDLFVANSDGPSQVWINQGGAQGGTDGVFLDSGQRLSHATASLDVMAGDVDGDGDFDAFVANSGEDALWFNNGSGQFSASSQTLGSESSWEVQLHDLDGDLDLDVALANGGGNTVWVNQGGQQGGTQGFFVGTGQFLGSDLTNGIGVGDVDGDGDADIYSADFSSPDHLYLNQSGGTPPPPVPPDNWQIQVVAERGVAGYYNQLALDSQERPHLLHISSSNSLDPLDNASIQYTRWDGLRWQTETVAQPAASFLGVAFALDSQDRPSLLYATTELDASLDVITTLFYGSWDGLQWLFQPVAVLTDFIVFDLELEFDDLNNLHATYIQENTVGALTKTVQYGRWDGTSWQIEAASPAGQGATDHDMALDGQGQPHIVWINREVSDRLFYSERQAAGWTFPKLIQSGVSRISSPAIAIDAGDNPHASYIVETGTPAQDELRYATRPNADWQVETVRTYPAASYIFSSDLALDSGGTPYIVYNQNEPFADPDLWYITSNGVVWTETLLDADHGGGFNQIEIDSQGDPHVSYFSSQFDDLRYVTWGPAWQMDRVTAGKTVGGLSAQADAGSMGISYYNYDTDQVQVTTWNDGWQTTAVDTVGANLAPTSLVDGSQLAYYDSAQGNLYYAINSGGTWQTQLVDASGDVGRYHALVSVGSVAHIAYWDATGRQIKLATLTAFNAQPTIYTNTAGPVLDSSSGPLQAVRLPQGAIGISYYDGNTGDLRWAVWANGSWTDEQAAGVGMDVGAIHATAVDGTTGNPVVAYYDPDNDDLYYSYRDETGWQSELILNNAGNVNDIGLVLDFQSQDHARIVYSVTGDNALRMAYLDGGWSFETVLANVTVQDLAVAEDQLLRVAFAPAGTGLDHAFRSATMLRYNPLDPCTIAFGLLPTARASTAAWSGRSLAGSLTDETIFGAMAALFSTTPGGQQYINQYTQHGPEMGRIALQNPSLLVDAYGTLQNFLPGLEAMVLGRGSQITVTQQMVDDALDIWTRIAAVASPGLASVISAELAQSNNLQSFVGMTFDEWALAIGVNPPSNQLYLPIVVKAPPAASRE